MRLTAFTDFGLRALMRAAGAPNKVLTAEGVSREFAISRHHLTKIVSALAAAGLVATQRGAAGGFKLARAPDEISVGEVVRALEPRDPIVECYRDDGGACALSPTCRLKGPLARARDAFLHELDALTLADCASSGALAPARARPTRARRRSAAA